MLFECKITNKRQIILPVQLMQQLGLLIGEKIRFDMGEKRVEVCASNNKNISALDLTKKYMNVSHVKASVEEMDQAIEDGIKGRFE